MKRVTTYASLFILLMTAFAASLTTASAAVMPISEEVFVVEHNRTICYGGIDVRSSVDGMEEAGLVKRDPSAEGNYRLAKTWTTWGPCMQYGVPMNAGRLDTGIPARYITACDSFETIGGMRVTDAYMGDVHEDGVVYLIYSIEQDPCSTGSFINEVILPAGYIAGCSSGPTIAWVGPSPTDFERAAPLYRCDPASRLFDA